MTDFSTLLQQGNAWLFIPSATLLGALHGLEPGHSKTMMAAFIVAVRGTLSQAVLLGLSATLSHTAVVWAVAMAGLYFGRNWDAAASEPYFQIASAVLMIAVALWMIWRTWRHAHHAHAHDHHHNHDDAAYLVDTGHGVLKLEIFEDGVPPRFRLSRQDKGRPWSHDEIEIEVDRGGTHERYALELKGDYLESREEIAEPHAFNAHLRLGHGDHVHTFALAFREAAHADLATDTAEYQDAHEHAHAADIQRRFAGRHVTTGQIILFGLTGGLIPCPASITILLVCLQLKQIALGATLVLCFSVGLALTMVTSGAIAALSVRHVSKRWNGFGEFARTAPYFSGVLIIVVGLYVGYQGVVALT